MNTYIALVRAGKFAYRTEIWTVAAPSKKSARNRIVKASAGHVKEIARVGEEAQRHWSVD